MPQQNPFLELASAEGLDSLTDIVSRAAAAVIAVDRSKVEWRTKADRSPVSTADEAANAIILEGLSRLLPGVPTKPDPGAWRSARPKVATGSKPRLQALQLAA